MSATSAAKTFLTSRKSAMTWRPEDGPTSSTSYSTLIFPDLSFVISPTLRPFVSNRSARETVSSCWSRGGAERDLHHIRRRTSHTLLSRAAAMPYPQRVSIISFSRGHQRTSVGLVLPGSREHWQR